MLQENPPAYADKRITYNQIEGMGNFLVDIGRCTRRQVDDMTHREIVDAFYQETE